MSEKYTCEVRGDSGSRYILRIERDDQAVRLTCDCPQGQQGYACKHRLAFLAGDLKRAPEAARPRIKQLLEGADTGGLNGILSELGDLDKQIADLNAEIKDLKTHKLVVKARANRLLLDGLPLAGAGHE